MPRTIGGKPTLISLSCAPWITIPAHRLAEIPRQRRVLVTAHDAFGYFGRAYDVEVHGLQGISTADEADLGAINDLVRMLVARQVKAVFIETSVPSKNIRSLIQGCEAAGHQLAHRGRIVLGRVRLGRLAGGNVHGHGAL